MYAEVQMGLSERLRKGHWGSTAICVLVFLACIAIAHPVLEAGFSDDFSYIFTARRAAETGRLIYNGWACPMLGYQVYLGALFIRLFGFSFTVTRAAVMLLAALNLVMLHRLFLRLSPNNVNAVIAALSLSLGPITFGPSVVFFTDLPGQFAFVVALYCCVRAMQAEDAAMTRRWLLWAVLLNLFLGTVRQTAWLGALLLVPAVAWRLRRRQGVLALAVKVWLVSIIFVGAGVVWLAHAPYAPQESLLQHLSRGWLLMLPLFPICLLFEVMPLLISVSGIREIWYKRGSLWWGCGAAAIALLWFWSLRNYFPTQFMYMILHEQAPFEAVIALVVVLVVAFFAGIAAHAAIDECQTKRQPRTSGPTSRDLLWVLLPYTVVCAALIMTRESMWSRYVLPLTPVAAVLLFRFHAERTGGARLPAATLAAAVVWAALGVIITHDDFLSAKSTLKLEQWYLAQGMPRAQLEAGMVEDGWYEISTGHYINEPRIRVPKHAWKPRLLTEDQKRCHTFFLPKSPDIHPVYAIATAPSPCYEPNPLRVETQHFWMRPSVTLYLFRYIPSQQMP